MRSNSQNYSVEDSRNYAEARGYVSNPMKNRNVRKRLKTLDADEFVRERHTFMDCARVFNNLSAKAGEKQVKTRADLESDLGTVLPYLTEMFGGATPRIRGIGIYDGPAAGEYDVFTRTINVRPEIFKEKSARIHRIMTHEAVHATPHRGYANEALTEVLAAEITARVAEKTKDLRWTEAVYDDIMNWIGGTTILYKKLDETGNTHSAQARSIMKYATAPYFMVKDAVESGKDAIKYKGNEYDISALGRFWNEAKAQYKELTTLDSLNKTDSRVKAYCRQK